MKSILEPPDQSLVGVKQLKSANPAMGRLWDLMSDIISPAFGEDDIFQGLSERTIWPFSGRGRKLFSASPPQPRLLRC
jgi:hypothetical protein